MQFRGDPSLIAELDRARVESDILPESLLVRYSELSALAPGSVLSGVLRRITEQLASDADWGELYHQASVHDSLRAAAEGVLRLLLDAAPVSRTVDVVFIGTALTRGSELPAWIPPLRELALRRLAVTRLPTEVGHLLRGLAELEHRPDLAHHLEGLASSWLEDGPPTPICDCSECGEAFELVIDALPQSLDPLAEIARQQGHRWWADAIDAITGSSCPHCGQPASERTA